MRIGFTTAAVLMCLASLSVQKAEAEWYRARFTHSTTTGSYGASGDYFKFVAAEWRGDFSEDEAQEVFDDRIEYLVENRKTCKPGRVDRRMANDRYMVYGWKNTTRGSSGWVAVRLHSNNTYSYITNYGRERYGTTGWRIESWRSNATNGHTIKIQFAEAGNGCLAGILFAPQ